MVDSPSPTSSAADRSAPASPPPPRARRRWLQWLGILVLLLVLVIVLLPTLISLGVGKGLIRSTINNSVNGTVAIDRVQLGWFSSQSVQGLTITSPDQKTVIDADVSINSGLLKLLTNRHHPIEITLAGLAKGVVREDNSTSFGDLVVQRSKTNRPRRSTPPTRRAGEPFQLPELPPAIIRFAGLNVEIDHRPSQQQMSVNDLTGVAEYAGPEQPITIDVHGKTASSGSTTAGELNITGELNNVFDQQRRLALAGASARIEMDAQAIPVPLVIPGIDQRTQVQGLKLTLTSSDLTGPIAIKLATESQVQGHEVSHVSVEMSFNKLLTPTGTLSMRDATANVRAHGESLPLIGLGSDLSGELQAFTFTAMSQDLTSQIEMALDSKAQLQGQQPSVLKAMLTIDKPFAPDGSPTIGLENLTGTMSGRVVPTAVLQPMLQSTPIVAARDIGPTMDVDAAFSAGTQRDITLMAAGAKARLEIRGTIDPESFALVGTHLLLTTPAADPALVMGYTNLKVDRPTDVEIELSSFKVPPRSTENPLRRYAAVGSLRVKGPTALLLGEQNKSLNVEGAVINIASPELSQFLNIYGQAIVESGGLTIKEHITDLFDATGKLDVMNAKPVGTLELKQLPAAVIARFAPASQTQAVNTVIGDALSASVTTDLNGPYLRAAVQATAALLTANLTTTRQPDVWQVASGTVGLTITPELAALVQKDATQPIELAKPAAVSVAVKPFDMPANFEMPNEPIVATISSDDLVADKITGLAEAVGLSRVQADVTAKLSQPRSFAVAGDAQIRRAAQDRAVASVRYDIKTPLAPDGSISPSGRVEMNNLSMRHLEGLLGQQKGNLSQWAGDKGSLVVDFTNPAKDSYQAAITTNLPNLVGEFVAAIQNQIVSITAKTSTLTLSGPALERKMNPVVARNASKEEKKAAAAARTKVEADVPLALSISQLRFPLAMLSNQPFDPKSVDIAMSLTGGPVRVTTSEGVRTSMSKLALSLDSKDLSQGVGFALSSKAAASTDSSGSLTDAGVIDVKGTIVGLVDKDSTFKPDDGKLQMQATVKDVPTALADAYLNMGGLLVAAVGGQMDATFTAEDFSPDSGSLDARINTPNGLLNALVRGQNETLRVGKNNPVKAELKITEPLRNRLLEKVHPVLADVRTTRQPLRVSIAPAVLPTDGDLSKLTADIEITIGDVEFESGSTTLKIMSLFSEGGRETIPGSIEPIKARIRNGVLKYETFKMHVDKYTMQYSGEIDMVKKTVDLHTTLPLAALAVAIPQVEGKADKIMVPLLTRGSFGNVKTSIDPDFDLVKAALDAGIKDKLNLDDLLKGKGGNLLEDLLNGGKNKNKAKDK